MDKQIEEMEKDIAVRMEMAKGIVGSMNNGIEGWLSEYLIGKGWAKIPEGAVVLTREEYDDMFTFKTVGSAGKHCGFYNILDTVRKVERKKTAEKFAERAKEAIINMKWARDDTHIKLVTQGDCLNAIDEIAKEISDGKRG